VWEETGQGGLTVEEGKLTLHFKHPDPANVLITIYRDGGPCATGLATTAWMDPDSGDYASSLHYYTLEAVDAQSGNASHLAPSRCYRIEARQQVLAAADMANRGGRLVAGHHLLC